MNEPTGSMHEASGRMTFEAAQEWLLARARDAGLAIEVLGQSNRELTLAAQNGSLEQVTEAERAGIGIRLVDGEGRAGYAYTEDLGVEALAWALAEARENAGLLEPGDARIEPGRALGHSDSVGDGLAEPLAQKLETVLGFEEDLRADPRVRQVPIARYMEREARLSLASTGGARGSYRNGAAGLLTSLVMAEGESLKQGFEIALETDFHALDLGRTARTAIAATGRLLGARPLPSGRYTAWFEPRVFAQLLSAFSGLFSGKQVLEGKSRLAGRLGQRIAGEAFTLIDDPTLPGRIGSRPFDAEGRPAAPLTLVDRGQLRAFLHNAETARALGQPNSGHAWRSYRGPLDVAPSNLYVPAGPGLQPATGVIVTDLMGLHAGANPISGDFSLQALGLELRGGELAAPVENFAVSGNFLDLLQRIVGLGDTLEWHFMGACVGAPMVEVDGLSFAGA